MIKTGSADLQRQGFRDVSEKSLKYLTHGVADFSLYKATFHMLSVLKFSSPKAASVHAINVS